MAKRLPPDEGKTKFGGRMRRYARVGQAMGGIATRLTGNKVFGIGVDQDRMAADLRSALGGLKGPLMKVAQILATVPDMLPDEYVAQLGELQTNAPAMGWPFVKRRMANELGPDWQARFASFEHTAAAAASLGQVHRARAHDGTELACKLQYPDMTSAVDADLRQLKFIFSIYRRYDKAVNPTEIHKELSARLREELDYRREARHQKLYDMMLADEPNVHVAQVIDELSTHRLLSMNWLDGTKLMDMTSAPLELRNTIAINMFHAWYVPFYRYGVLHGDPHLGNYSVREDGSINLLDFGCIRVFNASFIGGVIDLYNALNTDDRDLAVKAYTTWGFSGLDNEMIDILNLWAKFVYAPILEDRTRRIEETNATMYGAKVAGQVQQELRRLGGITPPREFVLMDRAAIGLGSVFMHLNAEVNWHNIFHDLIGGFDEQLLADRQAAALASVGLDVVEVT